MPRVTTFSDDFNRANNTDLGSNWDAGYSDNSPTNVNFQIVGNRVRSTSAGAFDAVESVNSPLTNDQWAEITLPTLSGAGIIVPGVCLRMNAPGLRTNYALRCAVNLPGVLSSRIEKWIGGVFTSLIEETSTVWLPGDILRGEVQGSTLRLYRNNNQVLTVTDTSIISGRAGMICFTQVIADAEIDNYSQGNIVSDLPFITTMDVKRI